MSIHHTHVRLSILLAAFLFGLGANVLASEGTTNQATTDAPEPVAPLEGPIPDPALTPAEVVRIQLEALRDNNEADHGIEVCFRFASPSNQSNTGPVARFGQMIKMAPYRLMLEYHDVQYAEVEIRDNRARQLVTLKGTSETITYAFYLSRQTHQECDGCWMTDAVTIERVEKTLSAKLERPHQSAI